MSGDELVAVMEEGGYYPAGGHGVGAEIGAERGLVWKRNARGLDWDVSQVFPGPYLDAQPVHAPRGYPDFDDPPAYISIRLRNGEEHNLRYESAYESLRKDYSNKEGRVAPTKIGGLFAIWQIIADELDHRAVRAAHFTRRIPHYLIVPMAEAIWRLSQNESGQNLKRQRDVEAGCIRLWNEIRDGASIESVLSRYDGMAAFAVECPQIVWQAQREIIEGLLWNREEELKIGVSLHYRHYACRHMLRRLSIGERIREWANRDGFGHLDLLTQLGYYVVHLRTSSGQDERFETLGGFCEWAAGAVGSVGSDAVRKAVSSSEYWNGPGSGRKDASSVQVLLRGLSQRWFDHLRSLE